MSSADARAGSWNELTDLLFAGSWREGIGRFRSTCAFRGVTDARHDLRTTLTRLGARAGELEGHILRNFRKYAQGHVALGRVGAPGDSTWNWLAVAQHHGLPTRMLDWTYSPFVALHFATEEVERSERDAAVWVVDYARTNAFLPRPLQRVLAEEGADVFTAEMLSRVAPSLAEFDALAAERFVVFFEPPSLDDRIVNQFSLFSLLSDPRIGLEQWLAGHPEVWRRIVIPASLRWEVRDKLDQANVTERVLYPGLDGLCRWLARYYTPRAEGAGPRA
jgi:hypothetical protein